MNKTLVYSKVDMLKIQTLWESSVCPEEIKVLNFKLETAPFPELKTIEAKVARKNCRDGRDGRDGREGNSWRITYVEQPPNPIIFSSLGADVKRVRSILNKICENNYAELIKETKTFNYASPEVVTAIFDKIMTEPFFSDIYARFCKDLEKLHDIVDVWYIAEFNKTKHKNLGKFVGELFKLGIIDLTNCLDTLMTGIRDDHTESYIETFKCIVMTVGAKHTIFTIAIEELDEMKNTFTPRYKFMVMDLVDESLGQTSKARANLRKLTVKL